MCGHCTERAALAECLAMAATGGGPPCDPLLLPVHLQEAEEWRHVLRTAAGGDDLMLAIIALCRDSSARLLHGEPASLRNTLSPALHARLDRWLASLDLPAPWAWLRDEDLLPARLPLDAARSELDDYLAGWLRAPPGHQAAWNNTMLHERMPRLSAALDVLHRDAPDDERLVVLALSSPGAASPFSAIDLWLQRRAVRSVIAHRGIGFVLPLLERWRSGTLLAVVLRGDLDDAALQLFHAVLVQRPDDGNEGARDLRSAVEWALQHPRDTVDPSTQLQR
ncbi:hypothetical protein [Pseudoxanthomonas sp. PXM01]|uniref:hypothetical protein n=1 Tax=Pseudoxanthomonas sp. PXM01 TaxID=2769295 RepID=UPI00177C3B95|nr:hypothetical protein [Pseudoxanthomonas sp. PXM01]MBD9470190.1 hypothetical protein [Pseudoxanthomonas sp. PXM01]